MKLFGIMMVAWVLAIVLDLLLTSAGFGTFDIMYYLGVLVGMVATSGVAAWRKE